MKLRGGAATTSEALTLQEVAASIYDLLGHNTVASKGLITMMNCDSNYLWSDHIHYLRSAALRLNVKAAHAAAQAAYDEVRGLMFDYYWDAANYKGAVFVPPNSGNTAPILGIAGMTAAQRNVLVRGLMRKVVEFKTSSHPANRAGGGGAAAAA